MKSVKETLDAAKELLELAEQYDDKLKIASLQTDLKGAVQELEKVRDSLNEIERDTKKANVNYFGIMLEEFLALDNAVLKQRVDMRQMVAKYHQMISAVCFSQRERQYVYFNDALRLYADITALLRESKELAFSRGNKPEDYSIINKAMEIDMIRRKVRK